LFGLFKSKANGGVSIERLAERIWEANPEMFTDDSEVRNMIIDIISSSRTMGDIKGYVNKLRRSVAEQRA
jgi:hypothetical protein